MTAAVDSFPATPGTTALPVVRPSRRPAPPALTAVEYFAGIGLTRMGLERAGWRVVHSSDWNPHREEIYAGFFSKGYAVRDVFDISPSGIPESLLATCSFPCVDLSLAGKLKGINGAHSGAFWGFLRVLESHGGRAPPLVLLENVSGWLSSNNGRDFRAVIGALNRLDYACDVFMLNARHFVPQSRPRVFVVGARGDFPAAGAEDFRRRGSALAPARMADAVARNSDLRWRAADIPPLPPLLTSGLSEAIVERLADDDSRWWPREKVRRHLDMMSPRHRKMVDEFAAKGQPVCRAFFRRRRAEGQRAEVRADDIAGCLRTAVGGSGKQFLVWAGRNGVKMRTMTSREYARLQGVPDSFPIRATSERRALDAFGDAVCVPAIEWIARNILAPLAAQAGK